MPLAEHPDPRRVPVPLPSRPEPPQPLVPASAGPLLLAPPPVDPVLDRLLDERVVFLGGELDDVAAYRVTAQLLLLAAKDPGRDIALYLHCPGGSATAALAVYDTMRTIGPDVATWAVGLAASVGQFLLTAGTPGKRRALPHARVVVRPASAGPGPADVTAQLRRELVELTAHHAGRSVERVVADTADGRWFTAEQAMAYGLVDHVGP